MKKNKDVEKLSVGRLPPELDKLVSNLIRLDRKRHRELFVEKLEHLIKVSRSDIIIMRTLIV